MSCPPLEETLQLLKKGPEVTKNYVRIENYGILGLYVGHRTDISQPRVYQGLF